MGTDADKAKVLQALSLVPVGVMALVILGGALWLQMQERRFEADRADRDRELVTQMLRESISEARKDRKAMQIRGNQFIENQSIFIKQQERLVTAIEGQAALLKKLKDEQIQSTRTMESVLERETQILIDAVKEANKK